jgi:hypothetical protein
LDPCAGISAKIGRPEAAAGGNISMAESTSTSPETEEHLIETAQNAVSKSNWVVGECAAKWTKKYARGRTDQDFGVMVGLSGDQIYQRRRVWECFSDVHVEYQLKWSHFYVALNWDDAPECLQWAEENEASVAEMKAWRKAQRGEDLSVESSLDEWGAESILSISSTDVSVVRDPDELEGNARPSSAKAGSREPVETKAAVAREADGGDYSPFRKGAGSPAPKEGSTEVGVMTTPPKKPKPEPDQVIKRMTAVVERLTKALDDKTGKEFAKLPEELRKDFKAAVSNLHERVKKLSL